MQELDINGKVIKPMFPPDRFCLFLRDTNVITAEELKLECLKHASNVHAVTMNACGKSAEIVQVGLNLWTLGRSVNCVVDIHFRDGQAGICGADIVKLEGLVKRRNAFLN